MINYNLEVLLERAEKGSLGIRSRQSGITLKEYFLNQKQKTKTILVSQKQKLNEALTKAGKKVYDGKKSKSNEVIIVTNIAGKKQKRVIATMGTTLSKVYNNLKKIASEIYRIIKGKCKNILKLCNDGIRMSSAIIKGKTDSPSVLKAKSMKSQVGEYKKLLSESLSDMRNLFKAFYRASR